jgi:ectoine hydroxylase-related dioxygenase (phytanoyl-CoA dioxygenase family)
LLLLLSDWDRGAGGTVLLPGSHSWVFAKLKEHDDAGEPLTHSQLNEWVVARMRALVTGGRVVLTSDNASTSTRETIRWNSQGPTNGDSCTGVQITGKAGDVVLMHPLLVHSGTTNLCPKLPRILANGMACIDDSILSTRGDPMMAIARQEFQRTFVPVNEDPPPNLLA